MMESHILPTGRVWVDPGGAFGLVPKLLWEKYQPVQKNNLVPMDLNSLLIISEGKHILVDNGVGNKLNEKARQQWGLEYPEGSLEDNLAKHGLTPEDIDIVINTHLHSDHCGGNTNLSETGEAIPAFPNAKYLVQRMEFADAMQPNARTRGTYFTDNILPIWKNGQFEFLHGDAQITKHVRIVVARGHTRGTQCVIVEEDGQAPVFFLNDLASYAVHIQRVGWVTAYDVEPLETIATKERWQAWALENEALLIFQHDCHIRSGKLIKNDKGRFEIKVVEKGSLG